MNINDEIRKINEIRKTQRFIDINLYLHSPYLFEEEMNKRKFIKEEIYWSQANSLVGLEYPHLYIKDNNNTTFTYSIIN